MSNSKLEDYLRDYLDDALAGMSEARDYVDESDLAYKLKNNGYCDDPYWEYEKALMCPINKRKQKSCGCVQCESFDFCRLLRREDYLK